MSSVVGAFSPFYYYPVGNICPVVQPLLRAENLTYGRCGPGVLEPSCSRCCSKEVGSFGLTALATF